MKRKYEDVSPAGVPFAACRVEAGSYDVLIHGMSVGYIERDKDTPYRKRPWWIHIWPKDVVCHGSAVSLASAIQQAGLWIDVAATIPVPHEMIQLKDAIALRNENGDHN